MSTYQNIFTQVQIRPAEPDMGVAAARGEAFFDKFGVFADETDIEHPRKLAKSISKRKRNL